MFPAFTIWSAISVLLLCISNNKELELNAHVKTGYKVTPSHLVFTALPK